LADDGAPQRLKLGGYGTDWGKNEKGNTACQKKQGALLQRRWVTVTQLTYQPGGRKKDFKKSRLIKCVSGWRGWRKRHKEAKKNVLQKFPGQELGKNGYANYGGGGGGGGTEDAETIRMQKNGSPIVCAGGHEGGGCKTEPDVMKIWEI